MGFTIRNTFIDSPLISQTRRRRCTSAPPRLTTTTTTSARISLQNLLQHFEDIIDLQLWSQQQNLLRREKALCCGLTDLMLQTTQLSVDNSRLQERCLLLKAELHQMHSIVFRCPVAQSPTPHIQVKVSLLSPFSWKRCTLCRLEEVLRLPFSFLSALDTKDLYKVSLTELRIIVTSIWQQGWRGLVIISFNLRSITYIAHDGIMHSLSWLQLFHVILAYNPVCFFSGRLWEKRGGMRTWLVPIYCINFLTTLPTFAFHFEWPSSFVFNKTAVVPLLSIENQVHDRFSIRCSSLCKCCACRPWSHIKI